MEHKRDGKHERDERKMMFPCLLAKEKIEKDGKNVQCTAFEPAKKRTLAIVANMARIQRNGDPGGFQ